MSETSKARWLEPAGLSTPLIGYGLFVLSGDANGFGFFAQPGHGLFWPLLNAGLFNGTLFAVHAFVLVPHLIRRRRPMLYLGAVLALVLAAVLGKALGDMVIIALAAPDLQQLTLSELVHENSWGVFAFWFLSGVYGSVRCAVRQARRTDQLEKERLRSELELLHRQIHPHFLFNVLNLLYSLALQGRADEVAAAIHRLSGLLRYSLDEARQPLVPLEDEISFLTAVVDLSREMAQSDDLLTVDLRIDVTADNLKVAPMLLTPLIENAFKHGVRTDRHCTISIELHARPDSLRLEVVNDRHEQAPASEPAGRDVSAQGRREGIGLASLRRRLSLIYPGRHQLVIGGDDGKYRAMLVVELQ